MGRFAVAVGRIQEKKHELFPLLRARWIGSVQVHNGIKELDVTGHHVDSVSGPASPIFSG